MAWVTLLDHRIAHVTPEDIAQIHYYAKLDRGGACAVRVGFGDRVLDSYGVTGATAHERAQDDCYPRVKKPHRVTGRCRVGASDVGLG